jgi:hypothetical protein
MSDCPQCAALRLELAREREKVNALRLGFTAEPPPMASEEQPLRHVLADTANETVKRYLGPLHRALRSLVVRNGKP